MNQKRLEHVTVRLSDSELKEAKSAAKALGMSRSGYLRFALRSTANAILGGRP